MKRIISLALTVAMLLSAMTGISVVYAASTVLYDYGDYADFGSFVRADKSQVSGIGGKSADDTSVKIKLNDAATPTGYFDLSWGSVSDGKWTKADYSGYLVTEFSVMTDMAPAYMRLCTDGNATVGGDVSKSINLNEWNKVVTISDRTGGANHGMTVTYLNGEMFKSWTDDTFGDAHNTSFKYHLRFLVGGSLDMTTYMDDVYVYETDTMPVIGDIVTDVLSDISKAALAKATAETVDGVLGKVADDSSYLITDSDSSASDMFYQISWTPKTASSKYFVYEVAIAPDNNISQVYVGTNQNSAMAATLNNNAQLTPNRWHKLVMVYDIYGKTSDLYINGVAVSENFTGKYTVGTSNCVRLIITGAGATAYIDDMKAYECVEYPEIGKSVAIEDIFDAANGIRVDNESATITVMGSKTAEQLKVAMDSDSDVRIYADATYETLLSGETVSNGNVVVIESDNKSYAYYDVEVYEQNTIAVFSEMYNESYNILVDGTLDIVAPVGDKGAIIAAQYDNSNRLVKLAIEKDVVNGYVNLSFEPDDVDNSTVKLFLTESITSLKPLCQPETMEYTTGTTVCFLGDSITQKGKFIQEVYEYYCTDEAAKPGLRMYNCGIPGDKTSDALARIDEDCLSYDPDVTFVMLGTNDMQKALFPADATFANYAAKREEAYATYKANMTSIIERLLEYGSKVILIAPVPYDDVSDGTTQRNVGIEECGKIVKELAQQYKLDYIDMYGFMKDLKWSDYYYTDFTHPSERGHHVMAQIILKHYGCVDEVDTGDYIRSFTSANAVRYTQSYHYRFVKHIDYSAGFKGLTLEEKKAKALATANAATDSHTKFRYELYYNNIETIDEMNQELINLTIKTSLK